GAMIPGHRNYVQQLEVYERQTAEAGLERMHRLRHGYACRRYAELTGWKPPAAGGPPMRSLKAARKRLDGASRARISSELGHSRRQVVSQYIGS
ncbi:MAG: integrase, partial [Gammaproteobacteria bacterium]|nr:integrase [Gammaproteobacteria bacterium]